MLCSLSLSLSRSLFLVSNNEYIERHVCLEIKERKSFQCYQALILYILILDRLVVRSLSLPPSLEKTNEIIDDFLIVYATILDNVNLTIE